MLHFTEDIAQIPHTQIAKAMAWEKVSVKKQQQNTSRVPSMIDCTSICFLGGFTSRS